MAAIAALDSALDHANKMDSSHHLVKQGRFLEALLALAEPANHKRDDKEIFLVRVKEYRENLPSIATEASKTDNLY